MLKLGLGLGLGLGTGLEAGLIIGRLCCLVSQGCVHGMHQQCAEKVALDEVAIFPGAGAR